MDTKTLIENDEELKSIKDPWPILSKEAMPGIIGDFISLATRSSEADPAAIVATFLTRFGAEIGPEVFLMVGDTKHFARIFAVIVGGTSKARKGTSSKPVERLFAGNSSKFVNSSNSLNKNQLWAPAQISPGPLSSGEGLLEAVKDDSFEGNDKRLFILDEEFATALKCTKRDGNTLSTIIRRLWDCGDVEPLTKFNKIKVTGAHVCITTHITLEELNMNFNSMEIFSGLANRFLWICAKRQKVLANPEPMPEDELAKIWGEIINRIGSVYSGLEITLTPEAKDYWKEIYPNISKEQPGLFGAVVNRSEAQALRLAMIYAILDGQKSINEKHLQSALAFWEYAKDSAFYIFGQRSKNPLTEKILNILPVGFLKSTTELYKALGNNVDRNQLKDALKELIETKRIKCTPTKNPGQKTKNIFIRI